MSDSVQEDLALIADVASELNAVIANLNIDEQTKILLRKYNQILDNKIRALASIVSRHEIKIDALEYKIV